MKEEILKQLELALENLINYKCDLAVEMAVVKLQELIPGKLDDLALEAIKPKLKEVMKDILLKQAEKISPLV